MVNILISTYNGEKYIEEQLDSIIAQTYQNYKVYIRDDGSTDRTVNIIKSFVEQHNLKKQIILIEGDNIGFCKSFFELLHLSQDGDYWAFCDQDDYWYSEKLELAVQWMEMHVEEEIPLLYHGGFELGNDDLSLRTPYVPKQFDYQFYNSITSNIFFGFSVTINRYLYEKLVLADSDCIKYHDWFAAMIASAFGRYHLSNRIESVHRQHNENSSPLYFMKKIPHGFRLLSGDAFYTRTAKEFMRLFGEELEDTDRKILSWFTNDTYSFWISCKKALYPKRWNPQLPVELILRGLMLFGII